jgi:Flp pilus assembly protein TadG
MMTRASKAVKPATRNLLRNERGAAIIELALIAPIFALMTIGIVDMSNAYSRKLALEQGAQRAIEKIMQTTQDDSVDGTLQTEAVCQVNGIETDGVTCKSTPITAANVTVTYRQECTAAGGTITVNTGISELADCGSGQTEADYISVTVTDTYTPMFPIHFSGLNADGTYHLTATAGMRTK